MSEHDRLLGGSSAGADDAASRPAHPVIRWAGALRAGHLPTNAQLYVGLHKVAGLLDGYSASRTSSSSGRTDREQDNWQGTERASQVLFRESAELLREVGRWITSPDVEIEVTDSVEGEETRKIKVPDGNSREQLQRLWFHAHHVRIDAEADLPEKDKIKETAREAGQDASEAIDSLGKLVVCAVTSGELQQIATQLTLTVRDMVADSADNVHDAAQSLEVQAGAVADVVRPDDHERMETLPLSDIPAIVQERAQTALADAQSAKQKAKEESRSIGEDKLSERARNIEAETEKLALLIEGIKSDPSYIDAVDKMLHLLRKYRQRVSDVRDHIEASGSTDGITKIATQSFELQANQHLNLCLAAAGETLEGLAGGFSLGGIKSHGMRLFNSLTDDEDFQALFSEAGNFVSELMSDARRNLSTQSTEADQQAGPSISASTNVRDNIRDFLQRAHDLFEAKPSIKSDARKLIELVQELKRLIIENSKNKSIWDKVKEIWKLCSSVVKGGYNAASLDWKHLIADLFGAILPSIIDIVQSVPVPRIEVKSDKVEATVDDFSISTINIIPDSVNVHTAHDFTWRKNAPSSDVASDVRLTLSGLRIAVEGVSFYLSERYTAPAPTRCWACCGCGTARRCGGGPAEWFAYTERALLDAGFKGEGTDVSIDFRKWQTDSEEEEEERDRFFQVTDTSLDVNDSLVLDLRQSRHWILNSAVLLIARPTIKLVLQRIGKSLLQHAFEKADGRVFDVYARARYLSWSSKKKRVKLVDAEPRLWDYVRVLTSKTAGKSPERIAREKEDAEAKEEAEAQRQDQDEELISRQPKPMPPMQVRPTSIIKNDPYGHYQIAIGLSQSLLPGKSGPKTKRIETREDLVEGDWKRLGQRGVDGMREAVEDTDLARLASDAKDKAQQTVSSVKEARSETRKIAAEDEAPNIEADGWKSADFDL